MSYGWNVYFRFVTYVSFERRTVTAGHELFGGRIYTREVEGQRRSRPLYPFGKDLSQTQGHSWYSLFVVNSSTRIPQRSATTGEITPMATMKRRSVDARPQTLRLLSH